MPPDKKLSAIFNPMSVVFVSGSKLDMQSFDNPDEIVDFLDQHSGDVVAPLVVSGTPTPLTLTVESKKVITKIDKKKKP